MKRRRKPLTLDEDRVLRLAAVLGNKTRIELLLIFRSRVASPSALDREAGADAVPAALGAISYHVAKLAEVGAIVEVGRRPRRGTTEHFYDITLFGEECLKAARNITTQGLENAAPGSAG